MDSGYEQILRMSHMLGFTEFTDLQKKAFEVKEMLSTEPAWIFVIGSTSSGKTLIPILRYFLNYMNGENPHMLFAVPYRALASQKYNEIKEIARKLKLNLNIQVSTGEFRSGDSDIVHGKVDIAIIIYEKIFMFSSMDNEFFNYYNLLVLDEIGLTQDIMRGIKADFILARAKMYSNISVIALGTPYYDWSLYKEKYNFISICETKRPIELKTFPVYLNKNKPRGINYIDKECKALSCGLLRVPVNVDGDTNPTQWWDEVVINICKYHLNLNHRILIYINNREEVHNLSKRLYYEFKDNKVLQPWKDKDECKSYICQKLNMEEEDAEDDLYGILDEDDYGAFAYGIGYHNASVPNEVRNLIEEEILRKEGHLRIVCCTETLAYGINSNVDVVIIPDMKKQRPEENTPPTFLKANEYMNYAGRAGRLQKGSTIVEQQNNIGYVYPFIRAYYKAPDSGEEPEEQQSDWEKCRKKLIIRGRYPVDITNQETTANLFIC